MDIDDVKKKKEKKEKKRKLHNYYGENGKMPISKKKKSSILPIFPN